MFNTYNCTLDHDTDAFEKAIKESDGIEADPLIKDLCEDITYNSKGYTIFSCQGHGKPHTQAYVSMWAPTPIHLKDLFSAVDKATAEILSPLKARKQIPVFTMFYVDRNFGPSRNITFRLIYKSNDTRFAMFTFSKLVKHTLKTLKVY